MALTTERDTKVRTQGIEAVVKVKGATKVFNGSLVAVTVAGFLVPAADTADLVVVGRADETVNNTGADGALSCRVLQGVYKWANSSASPVVQADVWRVVYAEDDQTVKHAAATNTVIAGILVELDADGGVWVHTGVIGIGPVGPTGPAGP